MMARAVKCRVLDKNVTLCFNLAAQQKLCEHYSGIEAAMEDFQQSAGSEDEAQSLSCIAAWVAALSTGGAAYDKVVTGEQTDTVTADELLALCTPYDIAELATNASKAIIDGSTTEIATAKKKK